MLDINDIVVDPEFEACCPALSADERTQLTANIIRDRGIREKLVVWLGRGILVDGHNRYDIWRNACSADPDMAPEIIEKPFKDREEALSWIIRNQLGRRNLTDAQRVALALKLKPELQAQAKAKQAAGGVDKVRQKSDEAVRVDDQIAAVAGKSRDTVRKVEAVLQSGDSQAAADMLAGNVSINQAAKRVKAEKSIREAVSELGCGQVVREKKPTEPLSPTQVGLRRQWKKANKKDKAAFDEFVAKETVHVPSNVGALANTASPEEIKAEADEPVELFRLKQLWRKSPKRIKRTFAEFAARDVYDPPSAKPEGEPQGKGIIHSEDAINCLTRIPKNDRLRKRALEQVADWIRFNGGVVASDDLSVDDLLSHMKSLPKDERKRFIGLAIQHTAPPQRIKSQDAELLEKRLGDLEALVDHSDAMMPTNEIKKYTSAIRATCRGFLGKTIKIPKKLESDKSDGGGE